MTLWQNANDKISSLDIFFSTSAVRFLEDSQPAAADCIYCACNKNIYAKSDLATCQTECRTGLGCFTGICEPVGLPIGFAPTALQAFRQKIAFPNLSCYSMQEQPNEQYSYVAFAVGVTDRLIDYEVDGYTNKDGKLSVSDFDTYFTYGGYKVSADCSIQQDKEKIALFGEQTGTPPILTDKFHVAKQAVGVDQTSCPWFESKEGGSKRIIHRLQDLDGGEYDNLIKCYEK